MKMTRTAVRSLVVLLFASVFANAQLAPEAVQAIDKSVTQFMSARNVPGVSVAIVKDRKLVWANGYGLADLENFVPVTTETVFRLASVSKPITATAILQLFERSKINLDVPVQKYCPAFPEKQWPVTTRQVLAHYGGIRHYDGNEMDSTRRYESMTESLQIFAKDPLLARPGTKYNYSTYGYTLLGCVLEGASGESYMEFVQRNILTPAGMARTEVDDQRKIIRNRAQGYEKDKNGELHNAGLADTSYKIPGGGLVATASDLARFELALESDTLLKPATREMMWTPYRDLNGTASDYGLGWGIGQLQGFRTVGHSGGQQRVSTAILLAPERNAAVVVLTNLEGANAMDLAKELLAQVAR
ncbi:MAG: beta-lactamase family protein [Acidobacteria bacterium]|jgi:CubicO group peptidase (beta-lactamase class C family)|nr:beta-lactamase family protein [Acidobacteriota bacterium]